MTELAVSCANWRRSLSKDEDFRSDCDFMKSGLCRGRERMITQTFGTDDGTGSPP